MKTLQVLAFCLCAASIAAGQASTVNISGATSFGYLSITASATPGPSSTGLPCSANPNDPFAVGTLAVGFVPEIPLDYSDACTTESGFPPNLSCSSYGFLGSGTYTASAIYSGYSGTDSNGNSCGVSGATANLILVVPTAVTNTTVTLTGPVQEGQSLTVVGTANTQYGNGSTEPLAFDPPTGYITLYYGPVTLAKVEAVPSYSGPDNATSTFVIPTAGIPPGQYALHAVYSGDTNYTGSTSGAATVLVEPLKMATSTALSTASDPIISSQTEAFTVNVTPTGTTVPTGTVTLLSGSISFGTINLLAANDGTGTFSVPLNLPAGSYPVLALYGGDTYNLPSTSALLTVNVLAQTSTTTTLTATPASLAEGQSTTLTAVVAPTIANTPITGTVAINADGLVLSNLSLVDGTASLTLSTAGVPPGAYSVSANYSGNTQAAPSASSSQTVTILPASVVLVSASPNPVKQGSITTLNAAVSAANNSPVTSGTVTFSYAGGALGTANLGSNGTAQLPMATNSFTAGSYTIQASFSGYGSVPPAAGTFTLVVN